MDYRVLQTDEYLREVNEFFERIGKYHLKKKELENRLLSADKCPGSVFLEETERVVGELKKLDEKYGDSIDEYKTDFACLLTKDNMSQVVDKDNIPFFEKQMARIGKKMESESNYNVYGIFTGILVTLTDTFFILDDADTGRRHYVNTLIGIRKFDIDEHRSYHMVVDANVRQYIKK